MLVPKGSAHSLQAEGGESQGARVSREEHVTPCVYWIPHLYVHVEHYQRISRGRE